MAAITKTLSDRLTAAELVKRDSITDDQRRIIEQLAVTNEMLYDAPMIEANDRTVNTQIIRTALPKGSHRVYNQGVGKGASQTDIIHDVVAQLAIYSEVDASIVNNASNPQQFLMDEQLAFLAGLGNDMADDIFYGNHAANAAEINGFATRRGSLVAGQCVSNGGSTANKQTSVYLIKWGPRFCKYIYPREAPGLGVQRKDKGIMTMPAPDGNGNYEAYVNYYQADYGIAVGDPRSLIRICNIDMNSEMSDDNAQALVKKILKMKAYLPAGEGTVSILCNKDVMSIFDQATLSKSNVVYTMDDPWGRPVNMLRDMRIRQCDAILNTEAVVA